MKTIERIETDRLLVGATVVVSGLCATLLAACGGNDGAAVVAMVASESPAPSSIRSVQLEGCVVDQYYVPRSGSRVRALSADGRLLGDATSGQYGVFMLRVPAREAVSVALVDVGGDALQITTGTVDVTVGACLQHRRD
jgi:hypothetical protein